jgi:hypothetical protein
VTRVASENALDFLGDPNRRHHAGVESQDRPSERLEPFEEHGIGVLMRLQDVETFAD